MQNTTPGNPYGIDPLLFAAQKPAEPSEGPHGLRVVIEAERGSDAPDAEELAKACIQVGIMPSTVEAARWHEGEEAADQMRHAGGMFELVVEGRAVVIEHTGWDPYGESDHPWLLHRV